MRLKVPLSNVRGLASIVKSIQITSQLPRSEAAFRKRIAAMDRKEIWQVMVAIQQLREFANPLLSERVEIEATISEVMK